MRLTAFVLCLLFSVGFARLNSPSPAFERLDALAKNSYAKDLLDTIALQLKSNAPVDTIISLLDNLTTDLNNQQQTADQKNAADEADCESSIAEFNRRINTANANIEAATDALARAHPQLDQTIKEISVKEVEITRNTDDLVKSRDNRRKDAEAFAQRQEDHRATLEALHEATAQIQKLVGSYAGKGIEASSARISAERAVNALLQMSESSAIAVMAQLAATADQDTVNKILALFEQLMGSLEKSLVDDAADESKFVAEFRALESELEKAGLDLAQALSNLKQKKAELEGFIAQQEKILAENKAELASATAGLEAKEADCLAKRTYYQESSAHRAEELEIIVEVKDIFTSQLSTMKSYLKDRVQNVA